MKLLACRGGISRRREKKARKKRRASKKVSQSDRQTEIGVPGEVEGWKSVEQIDFEFTLFLQRARENSTRLDTAWRRQRKRERKKKESENRVTE